MSAIQSLECSRLLEWLLVYFPVGVALTVFMFMALILLSVFFGYQLYLISQVVG
jgi:palmitoyltransferase